MAQVHVDFPGQLRWFAGSGPAKIIGPCPHHCDHSAMRTVAWGPDNEHYTLVECFIADGCAGRCRSWTSEYDPTWDPGKPKMRIKGFYEFDPATQTVGLTIQLRERT